MIKNFLIPFLFATTLSVAQKVQIKKGVIYRDKEPIAKLSGEVKSTKETHVKIASMTDEPIIQIDEVNVNFGSFFQRPFSYYNIQFPTISKSVSTFVEQQGQSIGSEKKLVDQLYDSIGGDFLTKAGLNADLVTKFLKNNDDGPKIKDDTLYTKELIKVSREKLASAVASRNTSAEVKFTDYTGNLNWKGHEGWRYPVIDSKAKAYAINQGGVAIGVLIKILVNEYSGPNVIVKEAYYYVLRKVEPFTIGNYKVELASLALLECSGISKTLFKEGEKFLPTYEVANIESAEMQIIRELISEGRL